MPLARVLVLGPLPAGPASRDLVDEVARAWSAAAPRATVRTMRTDLGGPRLLDTVAGPGATRATVEVDAPLRAEPSSAPAVRGRILSRPGERVVAAAEVAGASLVDGPSRLDADSRGVGQLVAAAADDAGPGARVVVGLAGVTVHDGGAGFLAALAGHEQGQSLTVPDPSAARALLVAARARLAGADLVGLVDGDGPLLGLHGATASLAAGADLAPEELQDVERELSAVAHMLADAAVTLDDARSLLAPGVPVRDRVRAFLASPGTGAGGGLGLAVRLAGGRLVDAATWLGDATGLDGQIDATDVVVVVLDRMDGDALHAGPLPDAVRRAARTGVPVVVLAREVNAGRRESSAGGVAATYEALADHAATLAGRVERVARTWTPPVGAEAEA